MKYVPTVLSRLTLSSSENASSTGSDSACTSSLRKLTLDIFSVKSVTRDSRRCTVCFNSRIYALHHEKSSNTCPILSYLILQGLCGPDSALVHFSTLLGQTHHARFEGRLYLCKHSVCSCLEGWDQGVLEGTSEGGGQHTLDSVLHSVLDTVSNLLRHCLSKIDLN